MFLRKLSLSSNMIDKIAGIAGMRNLKVLSLGRNYIKSLAGVVSFCSIIIYINADKSDVFALNLTNC